MKRLAKDFRVHKTLYQCLFKWNIPFLFYLFLIHNGILNRKAFAKLEMCFYFYIPRTKSSISVKSKHSENEIELKSPPAPNLTPFKRAFKRHCMLEQRKHWTGNKL